MKKYIVFFLTICLLVTSVVSLPLIADAAEDSWTTGFVLMGPSKRQGESILLQSSPGQMAYITKEHEYIGVDFDVEFTLQVKKYDGTDQHHVQVGTPTHRLHWFLKESGINCETANGRIMIPYDIGTSEHTYRAVSYNNLCDIYIDGYYVQSVTLRALKVGQELYFRTDGSKGGGTMVVLDANINNPAEVKNAEPIDPNVPENSQPKTEADSFEYHFDGTEDYTAADNWNLRYNWEVKDGYLGGYSDSLTYISCFKYIDNFGDDFTFEAKMRFPETLGNTSGMNFSWGEEVILFRMRPHDIFVHTSGGTYYSDLYDMSDPEKWYDFKVESYNKKSRIRAYVNGVCVADVEPYTVVNDKYVPAPNDKYWYFYCAGFPNLTSSMQFDWVKFTSWNYTEDIVIDAPFQNAEYYEGQTVNLSASVKKDAEIPSVSYIVNGQEVAVGKAPDYKATLKNLPEGNYRVSAKYGELTSEAVELKVFPAIKAEIGTKKTGMDGLSVSLSNIQDKKKQVASVEYTLDGISCGKSDTKPYCLDISDVTAESHTLTATLRNKDGVFLGEISKIIFPDLSENRETMNYSNEISYSVTGEKGNAEVSIGNGTHLLQMNHTAEGLTYRTSTGEETYEAGKGKFIILTDGPFADVYRNGQLAFSFIMPFNESVRRKTVENGLNIEDLTIVIPENRKNYFVSRNLNVKDAVYVLDGTSAWNNVDFVAEKEDEFELVLNDRYYYTKLIMKDGKFYTWTVFEENSEPEIREFIEKAPEGKNHYRLEVGCGMVRFYINGKWAESFRAVPTVGDAQLGVNVLDGNGIEYLAVNDYTDIYLYQDDFKGEGMFDSVDYWGQERIQLLPNERFGILSLVAADQTNAITEIYAFAGEAELSAELDVTKCDGGFWFLANYSIEEEYTKIGYNGKTKKFEIVDVMGAHGNPTETLVKEVDGALPLKKTMKMTLLLDETDDGKKVTLLVDGKEAISHESTDIMIPMTQRGKLGFILTKANANLYNVSYRGDAKPLLQTTTNDPLPRNRGTFDLLENQDGMVMVGDLTYWVVNEDMKTFTGKSASDLQGCDIEKLANGEVLSIKMVKLENDMVQFVAAISEDGGRSYEEVGKVADVQGYTTTTGNRVYQGASGRIYFMRPLPSSENDGFFYVSYSDDNGRTWKDSELIDYVDVGGTVHEPKMIELEDGHCIVFIRSEFGAVIVLHSYDYGETWDEEHVRMLPFFTSANAFNVEQDAKNRNIIYIGWGYDNANLGGLIQYPRTRWAVARTTDWGETWEYIGTTVEYTRHEASFQNMCFNITDDYIVHNAVSISESGDKTPERYPVFSGRVVFSKREKQIATKRFERLHLRYPKQVDDKAAITKEQYVENLVINEKNGRMLYRNHLITDGVSKDYILADYAATYVGARVQKSENGALFTCGDAKVFFDGDAILNQNGKMYIRCKALAEKFNLGYAEKDGIHVIGRFDNWSNRAWRGYRFATDALTQNY